MITKKSIDDLSYRIIGCCIEVHQALGPGLLESVYHRCLMKEFAIKGIQYSSELVVPVAYKGIDVNAQLRADFFIEKQIVLELKAVESVLPIHEAQLLTYMKLLQAPKGVLVNFNSTHIFKKGQKTFVNEIYKELPQA